MGIFRKPAVQAPAPVAGPPLRSFGRLDGTLVQVTEAEFAADETLQRESFTVHMLEYVDEGLPVIGGDAELRAALLTAIWNLTWEAQRTQSVELMGLVTRIAIAYTPMADFPTEELGDFLLDNLEAVSATRQAFLETGRSSFERDLSLLGATQLDVQEARPNREAVMEAITDAAKRRVNG
jgi:hypothetical protein